MDTLQPSHTFTGSPTVAVPDTIEKSYDDVPYGSHPIAASHPDKLYNVARLYGLSPVPPEKARILEIGCAGGGNILPVASQFPESKCVGIDLSQVQIDNAKIATQYAGIKNLEFIQGSVTDIGPEHGKFDYIICHGVFSWVPDFVRDAILRTAAENLSDEGIAFLSYNTYPGWHLRGMIRSLMNSHVTNFPDNKTKILQAKALIDFLAVATKNDNTAHARCIRDEAALLNVVPDEYIFHEFLEEFNQPFYFKDFVANASRFGLQFLGESNLATTWLGNYTAEVNQKLSRIDDVVLRGHYLDCISGRTFRETLLVQAKTKVDRNITFERLSQVRFVGQFQPVESPADSKSDPDLKFFECPNKRRFSTADPLSLLAIEALNKACPASLSVEELRTAVEAINQARSNKITIDMIALTRELFHWSMLSLLQFHFHEDRMRYKGVKNPKVSSWARSQAQANDMVTNLQHRLCKLEELQRLLVPLMDGTTSIESLAEYTSKVLLGTNLFKLDPTMEPRKNDPALATQLVQKIIAELARKHLLLP
jgi:methyltransferase-like protein/2-polyprenyl-3-methyl-5-hydroxy-6-metoxy-1,4-benzoquinol methylase